MSPLEVFLVAARRSCRDEGTAVVVAHAYDADASVAGLAEVEVAFGFVALDKPAVLRPLGTRWPRVPGDRWTDVPARTSSVSRDVVELHAAREVDAARLSVPTPEPTATDPARALLALRQRRARIALRELYDETRRTSAGEGEVAA